MPVGKCPTCDFIVEPEWDACRFCGASFTGDAPAGPAPEWAARHAGGGTATATATIARPGEAPGWGPGPIAAPPQPFSWSRLLVPVLAVALLAAGAYVGWDRFLAPSPYPSEWDTRVADLAHWVERERGLTFAHPVDVLFLDEQAYRKASSGPDQVSDEDQDQLDQLSGMFRSLGLMSGKVDLAKAMDDLSSEGTAAHYDFVDEVIRIRGTELTRSVEITLAHELTHVLQDQNFDLERLGTLEDDAASEAALAVVEGDAEVVADAYRDSLLPADQHEAAAEEKKLGKESDVSGVPKALVSFFGAPYAAGYMFALAVDESEGQLGLDAALQRPPSSTEQVLDPYLYLEGNEPVKVATPKLDRGAKKLDEGTFGAIAWYLVLSHRLPERQVLDAVDGWGGDRYVVYRAGEKTCVKVSYVGGKPADAAEMAGALRQWGAAMPPGAVEVSTTGPQRVTLRSCDPGSGTKLPKGSGGTLTLPTYRAGIMIGMIKTSAPDDLAHCVANDVVRALTPEQLDTMAPEALQAQVRATVPRCGG
jgi:hypothetical protein